MKKRILLSLLVVPGVFLVLLGCHSKPRVVWDAYLYRHTPVWRLAKAVWQQDTAQIRYCLLYTSTDLDENGREYYFYKDDLLNYKKMKME